MMTVTKECPECGGNGYTFQDRFNPNTGHYTEDTVCDHCSGSGEVEEREEDDADL